MVKCIMVKCIMVRGTARQGKWWCCLHSTMCTAGCTARRRRIVIQSIIQPSPPPPQTHPLPPLPHIPLLQNITPPDFQTPPSARSRKEIPFQRGSPLYRLIVERIHQDQSWAKLQAASLHWTALVESCITPPPTSWPCPGTTTAVAAAAESWEQEVSLSTLTSQFHLPKDGWSPRRLPTGRSDLLTCKRLSCDYYSSDLSSLKYKHATEKVRTVKY